MRLSVQAFGLELAVTFGPADEPEPEPVEHDALGASVDLAPTKTLEVDGYLFGYGKERR